MKIAVRIYVLVLLSFLKHVAWTDALLLKVPDEWILGLDGSFKAVHPTTPPTNTPFPCLSCGCSFIDRNGVPTHCDMEIPSRMMVARWLPEASTTLEVGARYGSNSCAIAAKQKQSGRVVAVDADRRVWDSLEKNRLSHKCNFHTVHGVIGRQDVSIVENGYGTLAAPGSGLGSKTPGIVVPHFTLDAVQQQYNLKFDVANFDCEGCLPYVLKDFPQLTAQLKLLLIESHDAQEEAVVGQLLTQGWELVDQINRQRVLVNKSQEYKPELHARSPQVASQPTYLFDADPSCQVAAGAFRGNVGLSCEQVCAARSMRCEQAGMKKLSTEAQVAKAFLATGHACTSFVDHKLPSYWAGPWNAGGICGYSSHPEWQPNCRGKAACGFRLVCSCH